MLYLFLPNNQNDNNVNNHKGLKYGSKLDKSQNLQHLCNPFERDLWCGNHYGDSRTQIGRQPDKEIENFEKPDRANRIRGNRKISSKFIFGISVGNWICCWREDCQHKPCSGHLCSIDLTFLIHFNRTQVQSLSCLRHTINKSANDVFAKKNRLREAVQYYFVDMNRKGGIPPSHPLWTIHKDDHRKTST